MNVRIRAPFAHVCVMATLGLCGLLFVIACTSSTPADEAEEHGHGQHHHHHHHHHDATVDDPDALPLHVGVILPRSGAHAALGDDCYDGLRLSGLDGFSYGGVQFELTVFDCEGSAPHAGERAEAALAAGNRVLVGGLTDAAARAIAGVARAAAPEHVAVVTPAATGYDLTVEHDNLVQLPAHDARQASATAEALAWALGEQELTVALVYDGGSDYGMDLAFSFQRRFEELSAAVVHEALFVPGDDDETGYAALIDEVRQSGATSVYMPATLEAAAPILREAREAWSDLHIFGSDAWHSEALIEHAGAATFDDLSKVYVPSHFFPDDPRAARFVEHYQRHNDNRTPSALAALGYDTGQLLKQALMRAIDEAGGEPPSASQISAALHSPGHIHGASNVFHIDPESRRSDRQPLFAQVTPHGFRFHEEMSATVAADQTTTVLGHVRQVEQAQDDGTLIATVTIPVVADWASVEHWHVHDSAGEVIAHIELDKQSVAQHEDELHITGKFERTPGVRNPRPGDRISNRGRLAPVGH